MVNIKNVYDTVLFILNKENKGYITKDEFNSLARQVQLEIFESYFINKAASLQGKNNTPFADPTMNIEEKITFFETESTITPTEGLHAYPSNFYRLGVVSLNNIVVDMVSHKDLRYITLSPLTFPTLTQPVFTREENGIRIAPTAGDAVFTYLRRPVDPVVEGVVVNSTFVQDVGASTNFELHPSEEHELVVRLLTYSGVIIRDPEIVQIASGKEGQITQTEQ